MGLRSQQILAHLNEMIRFYRMTLSPVQKIGEPSDMLYAEQAQALATQAAQLAFQSARDEAALLARIQGKPGAASTGEASSEGQKLAAAELNTARQIQSFDTQIEALDKQIATARSSARPELEQQKEQVQGQLELANAMAEALAKVSGISSSQGNTGLQGQINQLQQAAPELVNSKVKPVTNTVESLGSLRDAGVTTQASILFQLLSAEHAIDQRIQEVQNLHEQALDLRTPLIKILRATLAVGQKIQSDAAAKAEADAAAVSAAAEAAKAPGAKRRAAQASGLKPPPVDPNQLAEIKKTYDQLTGCLQDHLRSFGSHLARSCCCWSRLAATCSPGAEP